MWGRTFRTPTPTLLTLTRVPAGVSKPLLITSWALDVHITKILADGMQVTANDSISVFGSKLCLSNGRKRRTLPLSHKRVALVRTARIALPPPRRLTSALTDKDAALSRHASAQAHWNHVTAGVSSRSATADSVVAVSKETRPTGGAAVELRATGITTAAVVESSEGTTDAG